MKRNPFEIIKKKIVPVQLFAKLALVQHDEDLNIQLGDSSVGCVRGDDIPKKEKIS